MNIHRFVCALAGAAMFCCGLPAAHGDEDRVAIANKDGKRLDVKLLQLKEGVVRFRNMANSKEYSAPLDSLDEKSQAAIAAWRAAGGGLSENFRITAEVVRANRKSKAENYDDRHVTMTPRVTIRNENMASPSAELTAVMMLLGRPVKSTREIVVLSRMGEKIPAFERGEKRTLQFPEVEILYDDKNTAQYGNKYLGYVFLLLKGEKVVGSAMQPGHLARKGDELFVPLKKGKTYDDSLQLIEGE